MGVCTDSHEQYCVHQAVVSTYRAIESPDVVLDGSTTGSSSVSIALIVACNC